MNVHLIKHTVTNATPKHTEVELKMGSGTTAAPRPMARCKARRITNTSRSDLCVLDTLQRS
jgi:hypothetical protein